MVGDLSSPIDPNDINSPGTKCFRIDKDILLPGLSAKGKYRRMLQEEKGIRPLAGNTFLSKSLLKIQSRLIGYLSQGNVL